MNYCFHKSTRSRIQGHNGKSLLELAGVNTENLLEFIDEEEIIKIYQERLDYLWDLNKPLE